jgi:hypothetical protein
MNDNMLLLLFSLPYLYDFIVGIFTLVLMSRIASFNETLKEIMRDENEEDRKRFLQSKAEDIQKKYSNENLNQVLESRRDTKYNYIILVYVLYVWRMRVIYLYIHVNT